MILSELQRLMAGEEDEQVEFKPSLVSRTEIARYAVGIGNAGGGYLILGVTNRPPRQVQRLPPLSPEDIQQIRRSVYDSAQIHIRVENLDTPDGNVVVIAIPSRPRGQVFHTRRGDYLIRVGEDLRGLTVAEIDVIRAESGIEFTSREIPGRWQGLVRPAGIEALRELMREANAPDDLSALSDEDLLQALGLMTGGGNLRMAGLLLVGNTGTIRDFATHNGWQFFRMLSDTDYDQSDGGGDCLTVTLKRLRELVNANNPVVTLKRDLVHPEFPRYPKLALRELLVNALVHRDYQVPGCVVAKLFPDRIEITNPGGFLADITPENILHHSSTPRYPTLLGALSRIRLANAANLGIPRVFRDLLAEGKEPPRYWSTGLTVTVIVKAQDVRPEFVDFVLRYDDLRVDELLIVHYLTRHREISVRQAATICQRSLDQARETLVALAGRGLLKSGGTGRARYYCLSRLSYARLGTVLDYYVDRRLDRENIKARLLDTLRDRPLSNSEIRRITQMGRQQVTRLMADLRKEGRVRVVGVTKGARWHLIDNQ